jgi:hypothetical protein
MTADPSTLPHLFGFQARKERAMKNATTDIVMLLDQSGSMRPLRQTVVDSHNEFMLKQQQEEGGDTTWTRILFNHQVCPEPRHHRRPLAQAEDLQINHYRPTGSTALLDALGWTIRQFRALELRDVIVVVITDGLENCSQDFSHLEVASMIQHCEQELGWTFVFLAAGVDATEQAKHMGLYAKRTFNMGTGGPAWKDGMDLLAIKMGRFHKSGHKQDLEFTADERRQADERQWMDN